MDESLYIGITFGPITRVISYAKSTKELWAASYFFSYLAKKVITPFKDREFLLPEIVKEILEVNETRGGGLFPDRYIFKAANKNDFKNLCSNCDQLYIDLGKNIAKAIGYPTESNQITAYLQHTIKIYCFERKFQENQNIVQECENQLAAMECEDIFPLEESVNYLSLFFEKVNDSFLTLDAFTKSTARLFETIIECSAIELDSEDFWKAYRESRIKKKKEEDIVQVRSSALLNEEIITTLELQKVLKPYHKYIAFVKTDGDNMTDTIKELKNQGKEVAELDKALLDYNLEVIKLIEKYGGRAIFLGGDDLLFFAPVRNGKMSIFSLLNHINTKFNEVMKDLLNPPTLSFGVSISYYKHPMFEAIEMAETQLKNAKNVKAKEVIIEVTEKSVIEKEIKEGVSKASINKGKNSIAWYLRKHSGQISFGIINKYNEDVYRQTTDLISTGMINKNSSENLINSYTYWLDTNREMLEFILGPLDKDKSIEKTKTEKEQALSNYFNNSFNEPQHENMKGYMEQLTKFLITVSTIDSPEYAIDSLIATLRFVAFLKSEKA